MNNMKYLIVTLAILTTNATREPFSTLQDLSPRRLSFFSSFKDLFISSPAQSPSRHSNAMHDMEAGELSFEDSKIEVLSISDSDAVSEEGLSDRNSESCSEEEMGSLQSIEINIKEQAKPSATIELNTETEPIVLQIIEPSTNKTECAVVIKPDVQYIKAKEQKKQKSKHLSIYNEEKSNVKILAVNCCFYDKKY